MSASQHTEPPYHFDSANGYLCEGNGTAAAAKVIARINNPNDAVFIVRACNSHEALVALAEYALSRDMVGGFVIPNEIAFRAREALAKP